MQGEIITVNLCGPPETYLSKRKLTETARNMGFRIHSLGLIHGGLGYLSSELTHSLSCSFIHITGIYWPFTIRPGIKHQSHVGSLCPQSSHNRRMERQLNKNIGKCRVETGVKKTAVWEFILTGCDKVREGDFPEEAGPCWIFPKEHAEWFSRMEEEVWWVRGGGKSPWSQEKKAWRFWWEEGPDGGEGLRPSTIGSPH